MQVKVSLMTAFSWATFEEKEAILEQMLYEFSYLSVITRTNSQDGA